MTASKSRDLILREEDFVPIVRQASSDLGGCLIAVEEDPGLLSSAHAVARLEREAKALETTLDNFGARRNRTYVTFGELVACIRGLAGVKATALHLTHRLGSYPASVDAQPLRDDLQNAHALLDRSLLALCAASRHEGERFGLVWEKAEIGRDGAPSQRLLLTRNVESVDTVDESEHLVEIGAKFLKVVEGSRSLNLGFSRPTEDLAEFVGSHATEARCRFYESAVHNIQSMYDTYVLNTPLEANHPWLGGFRGNVSIALHLLEMATGLVHFYERHENDVRHPPSRQLIARVVNRVDILSVAVNICLKHAYRYVESVAAPAERILQTFVPAGRSELSLPDGIQLHARPLALIVQIARHYGTPVEIAFNGETCNASSLMSLIMLGGRHPRPYSIVATGDARALRDLEAFFAAGLGEDGRPLPADLSYLRGP